MNSLDIDVGGTFTDCVLFFDGQFLQLKVPTTPYNLSVGFRTGIDGLAQRLGVSTNELLSRLEVVRYSTTVALNALIQRTGPKLGVITTAGNEHMLVVGRSSRSWMAGKHSREIRNLARIARPAPLVDLDVVVGVNERIDYKGSVIRPLDADDLRAKVHYLVDRGVQGIVVALFWSHVNPVHENQIRDVIEEIYPDVHLGSMPIYLSSEVEPRWHEYPRVNATLLNAYLKGALRDDLMTIAYDLRDNGYTKPLEIVNNSGGSAKTSRTCALDTYGAGPVAGLHGSARLAQACGLSDVITTDMGGTSFDFGLILDGAVRSFSEGAVVDKWMTERSMVEVASIGAGGGSIAWLNEIMGSRIEVGPQSAASNPGPACYEMGGREPTVTDADVVLGYLNPDRFLGGRMPLNAELATRAIHRHIGKPLGLDVVEAASAIRQTIDAKMGDALGKEIMLRGLDPAAFAMFAFGGAGPLHGPDYARRVNAGMPCYSFLYSSVFCALGGATTDLAHLYQRSAHITLYDPVADRLLDEVARFNAVIDALVVEAERDIRSEGFASNDIVYSLQVDFRYGAQYYLTRVTTPMLRLDSETDVKALTEACRNEYVRRYSEISVFEEAGIDVENFYLTATVDLPKPQLPQIESGPADPSLARSGMRDVYWPQRAGFTKTPVFVAHQLRAGNVIEGPAVVEADDTTMIVPPEYTLRVNAVGGCIVEPA